MFRPERMAQRRGRRSTRDDFAVKAPGEVVSGEDQLDDGRSVEENSPKCSRLTPRETAQLLPIHEQNSSCIELFDRRLCEVPPANISDGADGQIMLSKPFEFVIWAFYECREGISSHFLWHVVEHQSHMVAALDEKEEGLPQVVSRQGPKQEVVDVGRRPTRADVREVEERECSRLRDVDGWAKPHRQHARAEVLTSC